jgi:hypothetical protein
MCKTDRSVLTSVRHGWEAVVHLSYKSSVVEVIINCLRDTSVFLCKLLDLIIVNRKWKLYSKPCRKLSNFGKSRWEVLCTNLNWKCVARRFCYTYFKRHLCTDEFVNCTYGSHPVFKGYLCCRKVLLFPELSCGLAGQELIFAYASKTIFFRVSRIWWSVSAVLLEFWQEHHILYWLAFIALLRTFLTVMA